MRARKKEEPSDRIAVDTGVWIHGLLHGGAAEELLKMAVTGRIQLITSDVILDELAHAVRSGLEFSDSAVLALVRLVRECAVVVPYVKNGESNGDGHAAKNGAAHDEVLDLAVRSRATAIATIHRPDLLKQGHYHGIPIVEIA